jgi:aminoacrylate hydrolase
MPEAAGLYYEEHGAPDAPPVILSSGLGGSASYWAPNIPALAEHFRVIAYDHRGTGRSDRALPARVSVDDFADDILLLIDALGLDRTHLIGHAAGGVAGLALALKAPERLDRLVVVNGWASPDPHFLRCFEIRLALLRLAGPRAYLRAQPIFLYPPDWVSSHDEDIDTELPHQMETFPGTDTMEKRILALGSFDIADRLGEIATRTLVIASQDDMLVPPRAGEALAMGIAKSGIGRPAYGGHAVNVTDADNFNGFVVDWMTGVMPQ